MITWAIATERASPKAKRTSANGATGKTVITDDGPVRIEVPRDWEGSFEPQIIGKHERRFTGFDQKIIAMYARGMTIREIQGYLAEMYGTEVSPEFISKVTDEVAAEITAWQSRPLEPMYPVVFFDALRVKIRDDAVVRNKAVYLALGVLPDGTRDVLGIWIEQTEGANNNSGIAKSAHLIEVNLLHAAICLSVHAFSSSRRSAHRHAQPVRQRPLHAPALWAEWSWVR